MTINKTIPITVIVIIFALVTSAIASWLHTDQRDRWIQDGLAEDYYLPSQPINKHYYQPGTKENPWILDDRDNNYQYDWRPKYYQFTPPQLYYPIQLPLWPK